jgi:hypothetical protein
MVEYIKKWDFIPGYLSEKKSSGRWDIQRIFF